ncbi:MAG TPA: hypothetical protein VG871_01305, partial [Vicinamibacterales bacterium]|nr:hypothetical protein [Vicinamibacterales bacterium]
MKTPRATVRFTIGLVVVLSCAYVALFIPPNRVGSSDLNMVGAFNLDEFVMYHAVAHMLEGGRTILEAL